jgi:hypothetical protein
MTAAPIFMLRTVAIDGTLEQFLPDFSSIDMSPVYCDAGTIQFSYPEKGVNYNLLHTDMEIAVTMNGVEIPELRSLIETIEGNNADDQEGGAIWKFTARTAVGKLDDAVVYPSNWGPSFILTKAKPVSYTGKNMGYIVNDLLVKAKARGALPRYTWDFDASEDSEGNSWTYHVDLTIDSGKTYLDLLKELASNGWLEFRVDKRVIRVWDANKMGVDRSIGPTPLHFRKGRDVKDSPRNISSKGLKTYTLVSGGDNVVFAEFSSDAEATYGRRESYLSVASAKHTGFFGAISTFALAGVHYLEGVSDPQMEVSHGLHFETEDQPRPVTNFNIGDWALTDVGNGVERFRILQWVMSVASDGGVSGGITMNWLFNTQLNKVSNAISKIQNGTVNAGSAPRNDGVAPAKVTGVTPTSASYFVNSIPRSTLTITWGAVTENEDGSDIFDLDYYQVSWKYTSDSKWRPSARVEAEDAQTALEITNLQPGASVLVRVRASDFWNNFGDWSTTTGVTLAGDTIAPNKPASPTVTSNVGTLRVVWSGLDSGGAAMPADLAGVEVHVSTSDFTPTTGTKKDVLPPGVLSTTLTQGLVYGTEYWVKLIAVDTTGNRSAASDTTSTSHVVLKQLVSTEIGTGQVGLSQTKFSDVGNIVDDGTFENADQRADRTVLIGTQHLTFDNTTSSNGVWSIRSDAWAGSSNESILLQGSLPVKPGERVFGAADYRQSATVPGASYLTLAIKWVDKSGNYLDNTGAINNVFYTLSDNGFAAKDNIWHSRITNVSQVAPANVVYAEIWLIAQSRTAGTIWIDAVEVRKQIDTLLIQQAAITTALIADLAVNDAKIASASIGKLTTGTLSADMVIGARIKTANSGARVEVNSGGFEAWNGSGTQTVDIDSSNGAVTILGQLKSGTSGKRIEINPTSTLLPEIRFYPDSGSNFGFLNAFSPSGSSAAFIGLNSGQIDWNGQTCETRLFMTDVATSLEAVRVDTQARLGPYVALAEASIALGWKDSGGNDKGYLKALTSGLEVGYNGSGDANDSYMNFNDDGRIVTHGRYYNYVSADSNQALFLGSVGWTSGTGVILSFGATMLSQPIPIACALYTGASTPSFWVDDRSTTGFSFHSTVSVTATCQFWVYRV